MKIQKLIVLALGATALVSVTYGTTTVRAETASVTIHLPQEASAYKAGPGVESAAKYCSICHSADYVYMQPPMNKEKWSAEVAKMQKVYGCPIPDSEISKVVDYLLAQNGAK